MPRLPSGLFTRPGRRGFYVRIYRGGRERLVKAGDTVEEARRTRDRLRGSSVPISQRTVGEAAEAWIATLSQTRNKKGVRLAEARLRLYLRPILGSRRLSLLTADDCRAYRTSLETHENALSPQSVAYVLGELRSVLLRAVDAGWLARTPFPRRLLPRIPERAPDRLTDEEVDRILATTPEPHAFMVRVLLATGLRWGEFARAQAADVERGSILVRQSKTGRIRRVPLSPAVEREIAGRVGRLATVRDATSLAKVVRRASGVMRFHVHQLRHTFACRWLEAGGSVTALQEALGHRSILTTQRYGRPSEEAVRREGAKGWR